MGGGARSMAVALAAALSCGSLAACTDGVTPDCRDVAAGCGSDIDAGTSVSTVADAADAADEDAPSDAADAAQGDGG